MAAPLVVGAAALLVLLLAGGTDTVDSAREDLGETGSAGAALALLLTLGLTAFGAPLQADVSGTYGWVGGTASVSVLAVPTGLTLVALAAACATAAPLLRGRSVRSRWTAAALTAACAGALAALVAALGRSSVEPDPETAVSFGAGWFAALVGAAVVAGAGATLGQAWQGRRPHLARLGVRVPTYVSRVLRSIGVGGLLVGALASVVIVVLAFVRGGVGGGVGTLVYLPTVVAAAFALGGLAPLHLALPQEVAGFPVPADIPRSFWLGDMPAWALLLVLLPLLATVAAATVLHVRGGRLPWSGAWLTPAALGVVAVLALALTQARGTLAASGLGVEADVTAALRLGWGVVPLALVWGVAVEAASRYVAPWLVAAFPALVRWIGTERPATAVAAPVAAGVPGAPADVPSQDAGTVTAAAGPAASAAAGAPVAPGHDAAAPAPRPAAPRRTIDPRKARRVVLGVVGAVVLVGLAVGARSVVNATVFGPEKVVARYAEALADGRPSAAFAVADPDVPSEQRDLLTDQFYADVEHRVTGADVRGASVSGDTATVEVVYDQDGAKASQTYTLTREGHRFGVFDSWTLQTPPVVTVDLSAYVLDPSLESYAVNGVERTTADAGFVLHLLPGAYEVTVPEQPLLESASLSFTVGADGSTEGLESTDVDQALLGYWPADETLRTAEEQARAHLDGCMASTEVEVPDCFFEAWVWDDDVRDVTWSLDDEPQLEASVDTATSVIVHVSATASMTGLDPADPDSSWDSDQEVTSDAWVDYYVPFTIEDGELVQGEPAEQYPGSATDW
ncbi:hypothetical protein [Puerhibacterium puerhi]|uniref:hypothetical protein n=1 Tax=Puerhibacterium puerhi TaxID=2692623 RepID=UPI001357895A|nr:hypothetical protein [Puerhibacterium puerhi]